MLYYHSNLRVLILEGIQKTCTDFGRYTEKSDAYTLCADS